MNRCWTVLILWIFGRALLRTYTYWLYLHWSLCCLNSKVHAVFVLFDWSCQDLCALWNTWVLLIPRLILSLIIWGTVTDEMYRLWHYLLLPILTRLSLQNNLTTLLHFLQSFLFNLSTLLPIPIILAHNLGCITQIDLFYVTQIVFWFLLLITHVFIFKIVKYLAMDHMLDLVHVIKVLVLTWGSW